MTAAELVLDIWTRKGRPVAPFWLTRRQHEFLRSLADRERLSGPYGRSGGALTVPGLEDRAADWHMQETRSGNGATLVIRIAMTDDEARAADAKFAADRPDLALAF